MIDQATIRGVERLKSRELIAVSADPTDGRNVLVRTAAAGLALINRTVPYAKEVAERTFGSLNSAERIAVQFLRRKMIDLDPTA